MALTTPSKSSDVTAQLIAAVQQLPQRQAAEVLGYVECVLEKIAQAQKVNRKSVDKKKPNPYLEMAGIADFDKDYSPKELDEIVYGL